MEAFCIHCDQRIDLGLWPGEGWRVTCPACGAYLEVISVNPVELDWAYDQPHQDRRQPDLQDGLEREAPTAVEQDSLQWRARLT